MNPEATATPSSTRPQSTSLLGQTIGRLAAVLARPSYPNGERAALRRWSPDQLLPLAYYRLWLHELGEEPPPDLQAPTWMLILWVLVMLGEAGHRPDRPLGQALAEGQYAEARLERLLAAPEDLRPDLMQSAVRFLAAKGEGCNVAEIAAYLLTQDPDKREALHRRIAADYYRHLPRENA